MKIPNITDLRNIYQILLKNGIVNNRDIEKYLYNPELSNYKFNISFLEVDILNLGSFIPEINKDKNLSLFSFDLSLCVDISFDESPTPLDIISALSVTIKQKIEGVLKDEVATHIEAKSGWHLDKDVFKIDEAQIGQDQEFYHPLYHMHFGGHYLTNDSELQNSKIAVFEAPRLIHPPLDGVLAIDFVLRNFYSNTTQIKDIINDIEYIRIINNARELYWKPYYEAIANYWGSRKNEDPYLIYGKTLIDNSIYFKNQKTR